MGHYKANLRDIEFNLFEVLGRQDILGTGPYADVDADTARSMLREVERLATHELAESFLDDRPHPAGLRPGHPHRHDARRLPQVLRGLQGGRLDQPRPARGVRRDADSRPRCAGRCPR